MKQIIPLSISKILFEMPIPVAGINSPELKIGSRRDHLLICSYEHEINETVVQLNLVFKRVWAMKVVYFVASDLRLFTTAYGKVVDLGETEWLQILRANIVDSGEDHRGLSHLAICFDDGPSYEFICEGFGKDSFETEMA
ncbi:MAG: hypothetical protein IPN69_23310 [Acidobacteria bacterium]|nr:hypothetical protein [Acidobacteriota bacterium]MBK8813638.1 hypothetical protein [Acidobacteriota bacterium]